VAIVIRLLPVLDADGAANMAADETMLHSAAEGIASLRLYGWSKATVSLGYFQPAAVWRTDPLLAPLPCVRRPSGGATLVHHHELTYALALPPESTWQSRDPWMKRMHGIITLALAELGLFGQVRTVSAPAPAHSGVLCFQQHTPGDLLVCGHKIVGSAQRKHRQALLQHGSILLAQSEHTPALPGIRELLGMEITTEQMRESFLRSFEKETGWNAVAGAWTPHELSQCQKLSAEKYGQDWWNQKR
jgi:lipoate-protein ligase A